MRTRTPCRARRRPRSCRSSAALASCACTPLSPVHPAPAREGRSDCDHEAPEPRRECQQTRRRAPGPLMPIAARLVLYSALDHVERRLEARRDAAGEAADGEVLRDVLERALALRVQVVGDENNPKVWRGTGGAAGRWSGRGRLLGAGSGSHASGRFRSPAGFDQARNWLRTGAVRLEREMRGQGGGRTDPVECTVAPARGAEAIPKRAGPLVPLGFAGHAAQCRQRRRT